MTSRPVDEPVKRPHTAPRSPARPAPITRPLSDTAENATYWPNSSFARCMPRMAAVNGTCIK
jgi:hypothetical protein